MNRFAPGLRVVVEVAMPFAALALNPALKLVRTLTAGNIGAWCGSRTGRACLLPVQMVD